MMRHRNLCTILCVLVSAASAARAAETAPNVVRGTVFLDANANGKRDANEKPLAAVGVTDGVQIVESKPDGTYEITIAPDGSIPYAPYRTVSVCWPSETWPSGPWWYRLGTITDSDHVDFALRPDKQPLPFAFIHVSDNHDSGGMYTRFSADVRRMMPMARFIINTGDLGYAGVGNAEKMFSSLAENSKHFPIPILHVPGNHDISPGKQGVGEGEHPLARYGGYLKHLGPVRWSFNYGGCHFVGVDWRGPYGAFLAADRKRVAPGTRTFGFIHYRAGMGRLTHMFYGHTHVQSRRGGATAVVNLSGNGGCNLGIVREKAFDLVERCSGCKAGRPTYHSRRRCILRQLTYTWMGSIQARRGKAHALDEPKTLSDASHGIQADAAKAIEFEITFDPGDSKWAGVRIGDKQTLEIALADDTIRIDTLPIPYMPRDQVKTVTLHGVIENGRLRLYVDALLHHVVAAKVDDITKLTLFARGGKATFSKATVWELK